MSSRDVYGVSVFEDGGAKRLMPRDQLFQAADKRGFVERAAQTERGRFVEGAVGFVAELRSEEDFALRLGDGDVAVYGNKRL